MVDVSRRLLQHEEPVSAAAWAAMQRAEEERQHAQAAERSAAIAAAVKDLSAAADAEAGDDAAEGSAAVEPSRSVGAHQAQVRLRQL